MGGVCLPSWPDAGKVKTSEHLEEKEGGRRKKGLWLSFINERGNQVAMKKHFTGFEKGGGR